jgi:ketopantoate reductase
MKLAIIGAGAMGSLFGARLSPLADVWLVDA